MILRFNELTAEQTKRLNDIAREIKKPYTLFIDDCCRKWENDELFWATPFAGRNTENDDSLLRLCRIFLAIDYYREGVISEIHTKDICEANVLKQIVGDNIPVHLCDKRTVISRIKDIISIFREYEAFFRRQIAYIRCADKNSFVYPDDCSIAVVPVLSSAFDDYLYQDRCMKDIEKYEDILFLPCFCNDLNIPFEDFFERIQNCTTHHFIFDKELVSFVDFFEILKYLRTCRRACKNKYIFKEINISPIVKQSMREGMRNSSALAGILMREMLRRMRKKGVSVGNFIIWYEGRPLDVIVSSAIRRFFPKANCVGYEGFPLVDILLSLYISEYQYHTAHCPAKIAIPSKIYEEMAHQFCKDIPLVYVPILRNEYLLKKQKRPFEEEKKILLLLSYFPDVSLQLLQITNSFMMNHPCGWRIKIKNHPVLSHWSLSDYGLDDCVFLPEFVTGELSDCLEDVDVAIVSQTSSPLEVLFAKVPLIIYCPKGRLGYTALPDNRCEGFYDLAYSPEDVYVALEASFEKWKRDYSGLENMFLEKSKESIRLLFV